MRKQEIYKSCKLCKKTFKTIKSKSNQKYCGSNCYWKDKNNNNWMRGKFVENHFRWKGKSATYNSIHRWVQNNWKKENKCESCGKITRTDWANKNHLYDRTKKEDWMELCRKCHAEKDTLVKNNPAKYAVN